MNQSIDQFGELKGNVDGMINQQRVTGDNSMKMYAPVTMGAVGRPAVRLPHRRHAQLHAPRPQYHTGVHVQFSYTTTTSTSIPVDVTGGGKVELYVPNRYYVQQWVGYENGAIIVKQDQARPSAPIPTWTSPRPATASTWRSPRWTLSERTSPLTGSDSVGFSLDLIYIDAQTYTAGRGPQMAPGRHHDLWNGLVEIFQRDHGQRGSAPTDYTLTYDRLYHMAPRSST